MAVKVRVGIVGTGANIGIASQHLAGYQANPNAEVIALYDNVAGRAAAWAAQKGLNATVCDDYEDLLALVEAVSICTPNFTHASLTKRALERGKHVLCEKPLGVSYADAAEVVKYARSAGLVNMIGLSYRGLPAVKFMKQLLDDGKLGEIYTYRETMGGNRIANPQVPLEWRMRAEQSGPGAMADFGSHMMDLADYLLRETSGEIREVNCLANTFIKERQQIGGAGRGPVTNDDCAVFAARTARGALLSFVASRLGVSDHTIEIYGSGGMLLFRQSRPNQVEAAFKDPEAGYTNAPAAIPVPPDLIVEPFFNDQINRFIEAVLAGRPVQPDLERGLYIQGLIDAVARAAEKGEVVML
ncbi:MAG: Gfo/Idh/MocA family protein [Bacteroidota bacterium]